MSITSNFKAAGSIILGLAVVVGMTLIGLALLTGAAAFSLWVLKWTFPVFSITLLISLLVLAPLALIPPTRGYASVGFLVASFALGTILWLWAMAYTYVVWGMVAVIIGLVMFGLGVVPVAMFAALVRGDWGDLGALLLTGIIIVVFRGLSDWLARNADQRAMLKRMSQLETSASTVSQ